MRHKWKSFPTGDRRDFRNTVRARRDSFKGDTKPHILAAISHTKPNQEIEAETHKASSFSPPEECPGASLVVRGSKNSESAARTVARHRNGMSAEERKWLAEATHYMRRGGRSLIHLTVEAHDAMEYEVRRLFDKVKADIGQMQIRAGDRRYLIEVLESTGSVHSHIIAPTPAGRRPKDIIERLKRSSVYGDNLKGSVVTYLPGLVNYLSKEATPEAHYAACHSFRRLRGSHKLGEGGGDRVRLSRQLEDDLVDQGIVKRRRKTYRNRGLKPPLRDHAAAETQITNVINGRFGASRRVVPRVLELASAA
jgi:hypothetical protein